MIDLFLIRQAAAAHSLQRPYPYKLLPGGSPGTPVPPSHHPALFPHHPAFLPSSSPLPPNSGIPPLSLPSASAVLQEMSSSERSRSPPVSPQQNQHQPQSPSPPTSPRRRPATPVSPPRAFYPPVASLAAHLRPSSPALSMSPPPVKPNLASLPINFPQTSVSE